MRAQRVYHTLTSKQTNMPAKRPGDVLDETLKRQRSQTMQNDTPVILFNSSVPADVEITVYNDIYHLHSTTLRNCSQFFDRSLSGTWWKEDNTHHGADGIKYRYKLVLDKETPLMSIVEPVPVKRPQTSYNVERMEVSESQNSIADVSMTEADNSLAGHTHNKDIQETYSDLFHIFYNKTIDISCNNFERIKSLVELADLYCSLPTVAGAIELFLIKFSRHDRICTYAEDIIAIASKIHSKTLYHDSFVHLVGAVGSAAWITKKDNLSKDIQVQVLEEYIRILSLQKEVDRHIIEHVCSIGFEFLDSDYSYIDSENSMTLSELSNIYGRNCKFCHGGRFAEEDYDHEEQKGDLEMYKDIQKLDGEKIVPGLQRYTGEFIQNTLKLDDTCTWGHLTCVKLDSYPWEEADDW
ncbi:hypothetical protein BDD12DRAFT_980802 [Trichophaea hybrida]|nr:hypothetical protein BDD12DRAFT_980802 [Trichophaea hybrida]